MELTFFFAFIIAVIIGSMMIPPLIRHAAQWGLVDIPDERKVHTGAVPRVGGIAIVLGAVVPILVWGEVSMFTIGFLLGTLVLLVFGVLDDRQDLDYRWKFLGQILAVALVMGVGDVMIDRLPLTSYADAPIWLAAPLTLVALVGITNAINLSDGLDGLAGGTTLLCYGVIGLLAFHVETGEGLVITCLAVIGATLGFLRYNSYPARVFMGDTGSQFLGFGAGVLAVWLTQDVNSALSPALPILILGLPILDTLTVMIQRVYQGRSPFHPDKNHIHHRLLSLGLDHYEAVVIIYIAQAALVTSAYFLRYESDWLVLAVYIGFCLFTLGCFYVLKRIGWNRGSSEKSEHWLRQMVTSMQRSSILSKVTVRVVDIGLAVLLVGSAVSAGNVSMDFSIVAMVMLTALLLAVLVRNIPHTLLERASIYVACAFVAYILVKTPGLLEPYDFWVNSVLVVVAIAVVLGIRFASSRSFQVTPLDFLVIFIAVLVPNLPETVSQDSGLPEIALRLIVLFYAAEFILMRRQHYWDLLRFSTITCFVILGIRGLI